MKKIISAVIALLFVFNINNLAYAKNSAKKSLVKQAKIKSVTTYNGKENTVILKKIKCSGYYIYRAYEKNGKYKKIARLNGAKKVKYIDKKVKNNKEYFYKAAAFIKKSKKIIKGSISDAKKLQNIGELEKKLKSKVSSLGGTWSVYFKELNSDKSFSVNNVQQYSASLIKAFAMAAVYSQIQKGRLQETDEINSLLKRMITVSDNDGFNLLIRRLDKNNDFISGTEIGNDFLKKSGYNDTVFGSCLRPTAYEYIWFGVRNTTTVKDCGKLLENIYKGKCVSKKASKKMLELLLDQQLVYKIPSGVPKGVRVANKTGETSNVQHDMAIVFSPNSTYILCVMSTDGGDSAADKIKSISSLVYDYLN